MKRRRGVCVCAGRGSDRAIEDGEQKLLSENTTTKRGRGEEGKTTKGRFQEVWLCLWSR